MCIFMCKTRLHKLTVSLVRKNILKNDSVNNSRLSIFFPSPREGALWLFTSWPLPPLKAAHWPRRCGRLHERRLRIRLLQIWWPEAVFSSLLTLLPSVRFVAVETSPFSPSHGTIIRHVLGFLLPRRKRLVLWFIRLLLNINWIIPIGVQLLSFYSNPEEKTMC